MLPSARSRTAVPMVECQATAFTATTDMTSRRHVEAESGRQRRCQSGSSSIIALLIELDSGGALSAIPTSNSSAGCRLFKQYVVDGDVQVEESKLSYQRNHQSELRALLYSGLADALRIDQGLHGASSYLFAFLRCVVLC